jgi:hypothetical protein
MWTAASISWREAKGAYPMNLFQSIFGGRDETHGHYPESLIEAAIERAVDGTDSRLRLLPGYRKRLREPVIHAIDQVVALVDRIPGPLAAGPLDFSAEPTLCALFASAADMLECFNRDPSLTEYLETAEGRGADQITALLLAKRSERTTLGIDLEGELLRRDVPQVVVSFGDHNVLDPQASEPEARRQLKRRAFDHLLFLALTRIAEVRVERADLARQRDLLRGKLAALQRGGWGLDPAADKHPEPAALTAELDTIMGQLAALGTDGEVLQAHLEIVAELLGEAEHQLWAEEVTLYIDAMNIQRDPPDPAARRIVLQEMHDAQGRRLAMLLASFSPRDLPAREDLVTAAERYY